MKTVQTILAEAKKSLGDLKAVGKNYCEIHKKFFSRSCLYCEEELDKDMKNKDGTWKL